MEFTSLTLALYSMGMLKPQIDIIVCDYHTIYHHSADRGSHSQSMKPEQDLSHPRIQVPKFSGSKIGRTQGRKE